ncbi:hypothetical protein [Acinetobacter phage pB23]|nr:hypothetical protein [Acinetobacter phage pB23]
MKFRVKSLDEVDEKYRDLYVKDGDTFVLKVEDDPAEGMRTARDHEKTRRQEAERELRELKQRQQEEQDEHNRKNGKVDEIEAAWQTKFNKEVERLKGEIAARDQQLQTMLIDNVAVQLAGDLFTSPNLALPHIKSRLGVESVDGKFVTRVKDATGAVTANTIDEFKSELAADASFAPILKKSNAGGGIGAPKQNFNHNPNGGDNKPTNLAKASPAELVAHIQAKESQ